MAQNDKNTDLTDLRSHGQGDTLIDPDLTMECMNATMGYYITLHKVVTRKLYYASKATLKRIKEVDEELKAKQGASTEKLERYQALSDHLHKLHAVLQDTQLSVEELEHIDAVFLCLPGKVKQYYDYMVSIDLELNEMIREISSEEYQAAYQRALKIINMVQGGKNVLSGRSTADEVSGMKNGNIVNPIMRDIKDVAGRLDGVAVTPDGNLIKDI